MMKLRLKLEGFNEYAKKLQAAGPKARLRFKRAVVISMLALHKNIIARVKDGDKNGRLYEYFYKLSATGNLFPTEKRGIPHRASAPGEAPANDQGNLWSSIVPVSDADGMGGTVVCNAKYGPWLEYGTHGHNGKHPIAPRPFFNPAFEEEKPTVLRRFEEALEIDPSE